MKERRGLGVIFLVFGALCCVMMAAASLYAQGRLRVSISAEGWQKIYLAHYFCTLGCGMYYLWLGGRQSRRIPAEGIMAFAVGIVVYTAMFMGMGMLLVRRIVPSWTALAPGLFLLLYGALLWTRRGEAGPEGRSGRHFDTPSR